MEIKLVRAAPIFILAWYRPLDASPDSFNEIESNLKFLDNENKEVILLGDINCDILTNLRKGDCAGACASLPTYSSRLLEFYNFFGFQQLIDRGTRETLTSNIAEEIIELAKAMKTEGNTVFVSGLVARGDRWNAKVCEVNRFLTRRSQEEDLQFIDNSNITSEHLNRSLLHLNPEGTRLLADNFL